jgi:hypothetical protein
MAAKGAQTLSAKESGAGSKVAVAERAASRRLAEPVWLVRVVLVLFLVGFASFLAREVYNLIGWL